MLFLGIDPGRSGGLGIIDEFGAHVAHFKLADATERDIWDWINEQTENATQIWATMEKVNAGVFGRGKVGSMGVTSAFTFGYGNGLLRGLLIAAAIPIEMVPPQRWQKELNCMTRGNKNVSKNRAQEIWPNEKITHAIADSLLIAEYGRIQWAKKQPSPVREEFALH